MRPFRSAADQIDDALDDAIDGDSTRLAQHDPDAAAAWELLADWAALGGLDGLEPVSADPWERDEDLIHRHERPAIMPHTLTMPQPIPAPLPQSRPTRRSTMSVTWTALAWLLIVAIGGGAIWGLWPLLNDREPPPTPLAAFQPESSEATPALESEIDPNLVANWAGEGNSWNMSEENPLLGDPTILATLGGEGELLMSMPLVVGDSVYFSLSGSDGTSEGGRTIRYDLVNQEVVWESPFVFQGFLSANGYLLEGMAHYGGDPSMAPATDEPVPTGIWLETGGFQYASLLSTNAGTPSAIGLPYSMAGITYWLDTVGTVISTPHNLEEWIWFGRNDLYPSGTINLPEDWHGNFRGLSLTANEEYLYAVRPSMTVVQYDRSTGKELNAMNLQDVLRRDISSAFVQVFDGRLIITAAHVYDPMSTVHPSEILILDADTMEPLTGASMADLQGTPVAVRDWAYVTARLQPNDPIRIYRIHPVSGTLGAPISEFETQTTGGLSMVMAGHTLLVLDNTMNTVTAIDPEADTIIEMIQLPPGSSDPMESTYIGSIMLWQNHPVVVQADGTIIVLGLED